MARRSSNPTRPKASKPWQGWQLFELQDFAGGLNLRSSDADRRDNEAADLWNVVFDDGKRAVKRAGMVPVTANLPDPSTAPTLTAEAASPATTLPAGRYCVKISWISPGGETLLSPEASIVIAAGQQIGVNGGALPFAATGMGVYFAVESGAEVQQQKSSTATATISSGVSTTPISSFALGTSALGGVSPIMVAPTGASVPTSNTTALPGPPRALFWWKPAATGLLYAICSDASQGYLYEINPATGVFAQRGSGLAINGTPTMCAFGGKLVIADGVNAPWFWDGTNFGHLGITAPSSAPTATAGASGNLNGSGYQWVVTNVRADLSESNAGPLSTAISLTNQAADLAGIPTSSDPLVTKRNIYRVGGTLSGWYWVGSLNDNTTTTFTDNMADADAENNAILSAMNGTPPVLAYVQPYRNRLYGAGDPNNPSTLNWSELDLPNAWGEGTNNVQFDPDVAGGITGLGTVASRLVATKGLAAYSLYGDPPSDYATTGVRVQAGTTLRGSICYCEGVLFWLGVISVLQTDGLFGSVVPDDADESRWGKLQPLLEQVDRTAPVASAYWQRLYLLACTAQDTRQVIAFDLRQRSWTRFDWAVQCFAQDDQGNLYAGLSTEPQVVQLFSGTSDLSAGIHYRWQSRNFDFGDILWQKRLGRTWIEGDASSAAPNLTLVVDAGTYQNTMPVPMVAPYTLYWDGVDGTVWDAYNWADSSSPRIPTDWPKDATGRHFRVTLDETSTNALAITSLSARWIPVRMT